MGRIEEEKIKGMRAALTSQRGEARKDMTKKEERKQQMRGGKDRV